MVLLCSVAQNTADVWKKDVWDFQALSQTSVELRFSLGNEGKDGKNLNSQTWSGSPRRPSSRHPRPFKVAGQGGRKERADNHEEFGRRGARGKQDPSFWQRNSHLSHDKKIASA